MLLIVLSIAVWLGSQTVSLTMWDNRCIPLVQMHRVDADNGCQLGCIRLDQVSPIHQLCADPAMERRVNAREIEIELSGFYCGLTGNNLSVGDILLRRSRIDAGSRRGLAFRVSVKPKIAGD
jgi:hypothetical protein